MTSEWNGMDEKKKKKYQELAEKDKLRYQSEMAKYSGSSPVQASSKDKVIKKTQSKSALSVFIEENKDKFKKKFPKLDEKAILGKLNLEWKGLDEKKKKEYEKKAQGEEKSGKKVSSIEGGANKKQKTDGGDKKVKPADGKGKKKEESEEEGDENNEDEESGSNEEEEEEEEETQERTIDKKKKTGKK